jgi:hypothetical protein
VTNAIPTACLAGCKMRDGSYSLWKFSVKDQQHWHFGTLGPNGSANCTMMQTACLVKLDAETSAVETTIDVKVRFLQAEVEREVTLSRVSVISSASRHFFSFPPIEGGIEIESALLVGVFRLTVRILNLSNGQGHDRAMLATHTLLAANRGSFVSLSNPPDEHLDAAATCQNIGTWPVLMAREGERSFMLSLPFALCDYPEVAPGSAGNLFDSADMDEIPRLRVLTLSEPATQEVRHDEYDRARAIPDRTKRRPPEALAKMLRELRTS